MLFGRIRRVHGTLKFIHSRTPDYIRLARQDVTALRRELLEALLGLGVGAAAGLLYSRRVLSGPVPFANLASALLHDLEIIEAHEPQISP